ncbi:MAG: 5-(carboxyamino)imidazole ribonucleotide mutase [Petroclostridium sp.]|jgi:5-(carboxyamino)imidazole ribonucleotide mutase|uniref:5-(carboxyamino)imidazole ribonucleotide mutase n=1 Tax=Petroclostridium xylanilyticum TaxID=1792311 RepID=UPI000B99830A|nr:5-(carboxyamino)imidazole ribonucleotide mutase [Petroclostridium xylanilyticum]MBZ4647061.1 phosphoribosylaminoimidazole carboxylase, catalytic subunit [Clostridia bacterium]MDK2810716.1 5-(carboxyamino)imidazole ribonucleotide mutase [Petroclostridium sp.]
MSINKKPKVAIVMGSDSDFPILKNCIKVLKHFDVEVDVNVISAHRTPYRAEEFAKNAEANGIDVIIGAAGKAAHLPGVLAAFTTLPVIGLPIKSSTLDGLDSLLSIVQMPKGIPVATVAIDGADNAAILAVQILSLAYEDLKTKLKAFKIDMARQVEEKDAQIKEEVSKL